MHNNYTLFPRVLLSGKKVYYYYAYNAEGDRLGPWTTSQRTETAASRYCDELMKKNKLIPSQCNIRTFAELADGFWEWETSNYIKDRLKRHQLTQAYADKCKREVAYNILPYFGTMKLERIDLDVVENWFDFMIEEGYKHSSINGYFGTMRTMIRWAAKKKIIPGGDPLIGVERLMNDSKEIKIITQDEFHALFVKDWKKVWNNDLLLYTANKLAACTSMRCSEILGLRGEYVYDKNLFLCGQYDEYGYRPTKTKIKHHIPLTPELVADLRKLMKINGNGYIFSLTGGEKPVSGRHLRNGLHRALKKIGISREEAMERGLHFHAWRHFFTTEMLKAGMSVKKAQAVTGHKSERITEIYTHFNPMEFEEVTQIQTALLTKKPEMAEESKTGQPVLKLVKGQQPKQPNVQSVAS